MSLSHFVLQRLIGPLSDKELRVASRRGRSFALRSGYLVLLCGIGLPALTLLRVLVAQMCFFLSQTRSQELLSVAAYLFGRLGAVVLMLGLGLYFGVRLRTATAAVTATLLTFLGVNYFLIGTYNPLSSWLFGKIVANYANRGGYYLLLHRVATAGVTFVLDIILGLFLWRRARRNVREYVF